MGNTSSLNTNSFEYLQEILSEQTNQKYLIINTLPESEQDCLIYRTCDYREEENLVNQYLQKGETDVVIIIYGKNNTCQNVITKRNQLIKLGFYKVYVYLGGLFEWILLQDIYGDALFPTTSKVVDILKFRPPKIKMN